tara:strand:+ start:54 stop:377 length:324 start_codon:yes stop_codon:yes gene_type:complete
MEKIKLFFCFACLISILSSCTGLSDVSKILRNEKIKTTDEFLVKKREPLTEPPDITTLPFPKSSSGEESVKDEKSKIKKILKVEEKTNTDKSKASSVEELIINQIKR